MGRVVNEDCPIIPNEVFRLRYGDNEKDYWIVAPTHDSIVSFPDPRYNHLRYNDTEEQTVNMLFLPLVVLDKLEEGGIPITMRESITEHEYELYNEHIAKTAMNVVEVEEVIDPVEAEVQKAHEHLDEEINYYLKEWE